MKYMKKMFVALIALALAFSMCACEEIDKLKAVELPALPDVNAEATAEPTPEATAEAAPAAAATEPLSNQVIINIKNTAKQEFDPQSGQELILTFAYETPSVYIDGRDDAAAKINEYVGLLDETYYTGNDYGLGTAMGYNMMLELAQDNYSYAVSTGNDGLSLEYAASRTVDVGRADSAVVSLVYDDYLYTGGAHGSYNDTAYVFDAETGEELSLDKLSTDYDAFATFVTKFMVDKAESDSSYSDRIDPSILPAEQYSAAFGALLREGSWYLGSDGLVFFSQLEEFGPYAAGIVEFTIPYAELKGVIDDRWLPAERAGNGEFSIKALSEVKDGTQPIIDKVTADASGTELCLIASGTVYDVTVSRVDYADRFYETAQLWHCSYISDSAIQLQTVIPEGMPNIMLSYATAGGETHRLLISQSGKDGSLLLVDESIEAVG